MKNPKNFLLLTNNPLVRDILGDWYEIAFLEVSLRDILVKARDMAHMGHRLYTHPLSGSVKPNETPYKSILLSKAPGPFDADSALMAEDAIAACDKFSPRGIVFTDKLHSDFQVVDYGLICGALDFDAASGLSAYHNHSKKED